MAASASASGSMTSYWIKFFKEAGIPAGEATNYAITFTDQRISQNMLLDLNKEYLADMGINVLGDVIAILKHSKTVHEQDAAKQRAMRAATAESSPSPRRSTPASRTVNHYLGSDPEAQPMNAPAKPGPKMSRELAARLGPTPEAAEVKPEVVRVSLVPATAPHPPAPRSAPRPAAPRPAAPRPAASSSTGAPPVKVPKVRRVLPEHEGRYKIIMPQGTTERSRRALQKQDQVPRPKKGSVFGRLGGEKESETETKTGTSKYVLLNADLQETSVFKRLGEATKRAATSTSHDSSSSSSSSVEEESEEEVTSPLEYAGVLKQDEAAKARLISDRKKVQEKRRLLQAAAAKKKKLLEAAQQRRRRLEERLGPQKSEVTTTAGILSLDARKKSQTAAAATPCNNSAVTSTTSKPPAMSGVHARLGRQHTEVSSSVSPSKGGVFKRLGKPVT